MGAHSGEDTRPRHAQPRAEGNVRCCYFFAAALTFAHLAFCAAAIRLLAAADIFFRGLAPLFLATLPLASSALIFAQRARVAAAILALPAADNWRVGRTVVSAARFVLDTLPSFNNARTCRKRSISSCTAAIMLSLLMYSPCRSCDRKRIAWPLF